MWATDGTKGAISLEILLKSSGRKTTEKYLREAVETFNWEVRQFFAERLERECLKRKAKQQRKMRKEESSGADLKVLTSGKVRENIRCHFSWVFYSISCRSKTHCSISTLWNHSSYWLASISAVAPAGRSSFLCICVLCRFCSYCSTCRHM